MPVRATFEALARMNHAGDVDLEYEIKPDDPLRAWWKALLTCVVCSRAWGRQPARNQHLARITDPVCELDLRLPAFLIGAPRHGFGVGIVQNRVCLRVGVQRASGEVRDVG